MELDSPALREQLSLLQHRLGGFGLLVWGVAIVRRVRRTSTRRRARTFSRSVQSIVTLFRTVRTNSWAMVRSFSSPST